MRSLLPGAGPRMVDDKSYCTHCYLKLTCPIDLNALRLGTRSHFQDEGHFPRASPIRGPGGDLHGTTNS
jgi:hypothetical protein